MTAVGVGRNNGSSCLEGLVGPPGGLFPRVTSLGARTKVSAPELFPHRIASSDSLERYIHLYGEVFGSPNKLGIQVLNPLPRFPQQTLKFNRWVQRPEVNPGLSKWRPVRARHIAVSAFRRVSGLKAPQQDASIQSSKDQNPEDLVGKSTCIKRTCLFKPLAGFCRLLGTKSGCEQSLEAAKGFDLCV